MQELRLRPVVHVGRHAVPAPCGCETGLSLPPVGMDLNGQRRADRVPVLDSGILFDGSNKVADGLDMGAKVGANMRSSQASPSDVCRTLLQVDGASADIERRPATG